MIFTILPACGDATRIFGIPKFLLPINDTTLINNIFNTIKDISNNTVIVPTQPKYCDTLYDHIKSDKIIITMKTTTMSETVYNLKNIISGNTLLIMPDTYFYPQNMSNFINYLTPGIDICLGVWKIRHDQRGKLGQCCIDDDNMLIDIIDKDPTCHFEWAWGIAIWKQNMWKYINPNDPHVGYAFKVALKNNYKIKCYKFDNEYFDCGTINEYKRLLTIL